MWGIVGLRRTTRDTGARKSESFSFFFFHRKIYGLLPLLQVSVIKARQFRSVFLTFNCSNKCKLLASLTFINVRYTVNVQISKYIGVI